MATSFLAHVLLASSLASVAVAQTTITVDVGTKYQKIEGFGFSQAFGRAREFQQAASGLQKQALNYLFNTSTGAGFSIIRNRIGSGGSGDSILPTNPGSPNATPSYVWDNDDRGQVWFTKQALAYGVKTIYADAWSAPGFMKTSGSESTPGYLCGTTGHSCTSGDWRQAYANFLVQYVKYYAQIGATVTHLGFLNEPDYKPSYSQMQINDDTQDAMSFIPTLASTIKSAGLSTKIACCDAVGWPKQTTYTRALVAGGMEAYLGVMTSHTYAGDASSPLPTKLQSWVTESGVTQAFTTTWYSSGAATEGMTWANKLAQGMVAGNLSAYLYWEGFELNQTQSQSHLVDTLDGTNATPAGLFWAFAMWSRYVRPGASRVSTAGTATNVVTGAFQNSDGSVVVVLTNNGTAAQSVKLAFSSGGGFVPTQAAAWATDSDRRFVAISAPLSSGAVTLSVPAKGVVSAKLTS